MNFNQLKNVKKEYKIKTQRGLNKNLQKLDEYPLTEYMCKLT